MNRISLRLRIVLFSSAIVVGVVLSVLAIVSFMMQRQVEESVLRASTRTNEVLKQVIVDRQHQLERDTGLLADRPGTKSVWQADAPTISEHLDEIRHLIDADWIMLARNDGKIGGCSKSGMFVVGSKVNDQFGIDAVLDGKSWRGYASVGDRLFIAATKAINVGSVYQATLTSGIAVDNDLAKEIGRAAQVEFVLMKGDQVVASTIDDIRLGNSSALIRRIGFHGTTYVGTVAKVSGSPTDRPLSFISLSDEQLIVGPFSRLWNGLIVLLVVALVAAVIVSASLAVNLTRPLDGLISSAVQLQQGEWPEPFHSQREDEIGLLQTVFDEMTDSLKVSKERLLSMLQIDPLTELPNHRTFRERLVSAISEATDESACLSLILIDLDGFDEYNRIHGSDQGDRILRVVADIIREVTPVEALVSRHGGNEFAIAHRYEVPMDIAETVRTMIERQTQVTVSIGISVLSEGTHRADMMILAAEIAVEQAKLGGRNRTRMFESFAVGSTTEGLSTVLQQGSYAAVRALAEAVDAKDEYTRGHSQRVAEYAKALALSSGYDSGFVDLVFLTGTLHDVGKIGTPDEILKKPGRLTDEEFDQIAKHPVLGEKIVGQIPQLRDALPGIRHHHERWDGRGYPDKLVAENIPLIARILAVADTFDAMTSDRPYRKGLSVEIALAEIRKGAGSQFDPELAETFVRLHEGPMLKAA